MSNNYQYPPGGYASPEQLGVRPVAQLSTRFLTDAFTWMFLALLLSAGVAWFVQSDANLVASAMDMRMPLFIAQIGLGLGVQLGIRRLPATLALGLFFVYAALMGVTIGVWVWYYAGYSQNPTAVVQAFVLRPPRPSAAPQSTAWSPSDHWPAWAASCSWQPGACSSPS